MTVEQFIEQVYLGVTGGDPSEAVAIHRADILNILGAAVDWAIMKDYYTQHNLMVRDHQVFGFSSPVSPAEPFLFTYELTPQSDTTRDLKYLEVPVDLINIPGSNGVDEIFTPKAEGKRAKSFGQVSDVTATGVFFYWIEKYGNNQRIYIKGLADSCNVFARLATRPSGQNFAKDDELPFPPGMELEMIQNLVSYFRNERNATDDILEDGVDDVAAKK